MKRIMDIIHRMKIIIHLLCKSFFIALLFLIACNGKSKQLSDFPEYKKYKVSHDTIIRDIPPGFDHNSLIQLQSLTKQTGLDSLLNGVNGLEIRIWFDYTLDNRIQSIVLKNDYSNWSCKLMTLKYKVDSDNLNLIVLENNNKLVKPKSGWNSFIKKLFELNILNLPDQTMLPSKYQGGGSTDSHTIVVEVASEKQYRIYTYINPSFKKNLAKEFLEVSQILDLIEKEFSFKPLHRL